MVDGLDGLRHDVVVGCDDDDGDVRHLGATCTHGGEGLVARGVEEGDVSTVGQGHAVGTDVLRDATGLTGDHVGVADVVQQRRLTVVHVAHDGHDRWARHPILGVVLLFLNGFRHLGADVFRLEAELLGYDVDRLRVESLIDGDHHTDAHAGGDDLGDGDVHHVGQVVGGDELRELQDPAFAFFGAQQFLLAEGHSVTFLAAILGAFVLGSLAGQTGQCLLHLTLHIALVHLRMHGAFGALVIVRSLVVVRPCTRIDGGVDVDAVFLDALTLLLGVGGCGGRWGGGGMRRCRCSGLSWGCGSLWLLPPTVTVTLGAPALGAHGLVDGGEVDLACHFDVRLQARCLQTEHLVLLFLRRSRLRRAVGRCFRFGRFGDGRCGFCGRFSDGCRRFLRLRCGCRGLRLDLYGGCHFLRLLHVGGRRINGWSAYGWSLRLSLSLRGRWSGGSRLRLRVVCGRRMSTVFTPPGVRRSVSARFG